MTKFKVGDVVKTFPLAQGSYVILELYDGYPFKIKAQGSGTIYVDERNNWKHLQWTLMKPSKRKVFK